MRFGAFIFHSAIALLCAANQQYALDLLAAQLVKDGYTDCVAPKLSSCSAGTCHSVSCGIFNVSVDSSGNVIDLFAQNTAFWTFSHAVLHVAALKQHHRDPHTDRIPHIPPVSAHLRKQLGESAVGNRCAEAAGVNVEL